MNWTTGSSAGSRFEPFRSTMSAVRTSQSWKCRSAGARRSVMQNQTNWIGDFSGQCSLQSRPRLESGHSRGHRIVTRMGKTAKNGPFTPIVVIVRNQLGTKEFNQLRGKAISLHSQVIKDFGKQIGAEGKQVQGIIRLAKQNGEKLGFLS